MIYEKNRAIVNDRLILSPEKMLRNDYNTKRSVEINTGRGSEGACHQDELIHGKVSPTLAICVLLLREVEVRCSAQRRRLH
jgi:hypothetical protein